MIHKNRRKIIFFPQVYKEITTDYQLQTINALKKKNTLFVIQSQTKGKHKNLQKIDGVYYFCPFYFKFLPRSPFFLRCIDLFNVFFITLYGYLFIPSFSSSPKILWLMNPDLYSFFKKYKSLFSLSLLDIVDYFETRKNRKNYLQFISEVDLVCVNSKTLYERYRSKNKNIVLVPQGFRLTSFQKTRSHKKRVSIGYIGGINSRLDYSLLIKLVKNNPQWTFTFCGPLFDYRKDQKKLIDMLFGFSNVEYLGAVEKNKIPEVLSTFKIGIIPYCTNSPFNKYCYPMKIFEYFYQGIPVLSTEIDELTEFPSFIKIGKNANQWAKYIEVLLNTPWPKKKQLQQRDLAKKNSWVKKISAIEKEIGENLSRKYETDIH